MWPFQLSRAFEVRSSLLGSWMGSVEGRKAGCIAVHFRQGEGHKENAM